MGTKAFVDVQQEKHVQHARCISREKDIEVRLGDFKRSREIIELDEVAFGIHRRRCDTGAAKAFQCRTGREAFGTCVLYFDRESHGCPSERFPREETEHHVLVDIFWNLSTQM